MEVVFPFINFQGSTLHADCRVAAANTPHPANPHPHSFWHHQVLCLSLENSIRPAVKWLGSPDPAARQHAAFSSGTVTVEADPDYESKPASGINAAAAAVGSVSEKTPVEYTGRDGDGAATRFVQKLEAGPEGSGAKVVEAIEPPMDMPSYANGEWDWGLGLGPKGRRQVVSKQGDILWKSVPGNLAKSTAWFVQEVGLSWDDMRKVN